MLLYCPVDAIDGDYSALRDPDCWIDQRYLAAILIEVFKERYMFYVAIAKKKLAVEAKNDIVIL